MTSKGAVAMHVRDGVCVLTLINPEQHNALTETMLREFVDACRSIEASRDIRAVLLRGEGKSFCAGADIGMLSRLDGVSSAWDCIQAFRAAYQGLEQLSRPTICAVSGYALGAGMELCLAADLVVAAESARFGLPEVKLGAVPGYAMIRLEERVGRARAKELMFTGRTIPSSLALEWGLINRVVADDALAEAANELACQLASGAPLALRTIKRALVRRSSEGEWDTFVSGASFALSTEDARRGSRAFLAKEKATFVGF